MSCHCCHVFAPLIQDDYTEELLEAHEEEAERLRAEIESKATMLPKVRDWHALKADEEELERNQNNPNRFSARGGAMLREEKLRKRVGILLPKVEADLLHCLPTWEEANARPFMVNGERVVDKIMEAREAKEAAKEAKKVSWRSHRSCSSVHEADESVRRWALRRRRRLSQLLQQQDDLARFRPCRGNVKHLRPPRSAKARSNGPKHQQ